MSEPKWTEGVNPITREEFWEALKAPPPPIQKSLSATWTLEQTIDVISYHGTDIEEELMEMLAKEIDAEILRSIGCTTDEED